MPRKPIFLEDKEGRRERRKLPRWNGERIAPRSVGLAPRTVEETSRAIRARLSAADYSSAVALVRVATCFSIQIRRS